MKKLTIGRNNACDIVIPDTTDIVSRRQAVLEISFFGKMIIYDTSNNGTFVNGERMQNGTSREVTRNDKISFGRVADLDWKKIYDPYRIHKLWGSVAFAMVLISCGLLIWWIYTPRIEKISIDVEDVENAVPTINIETSTQENSERNDVIQPIRPQSKKVKRKPIRQIPKSEKTTEEKSKEHVPLVY